MKISLICTVLNEKKNINFFIKSIINQSKRPEEFIIVDGGSNDGTFERLKEFSKKNNWIKVYKKQGVNISEGRNFAIKKTKNKVIAVCDAGGQYDNNWLKNLIRGFNGQVSFGIDKPLIKTKFHKELAKVILHKNVMGSSRNMIFLKKIWKNVGGYPEDLVVGEDTLFDERIKEAGYKISRVKNAICSWEMRDNLEDVKKQFYKYGYWDGIAYKRYKSLPKKYKLAILFTLAIAITYPLLFIMSLFSLSFKIKVTKRFNYLNGFLKGYFFGEKNEYRTHKSDKCF
jgi:glycosyltransferase involved in cell wall biosynthesis